MSGTRFPEPEYGLVWQYCADSKLLEWAYQWINIENIEEAKDLAPETKRDLVTHIGFFDLS